MKHLVDYIIEQKINEEYCQINEGFFRNLFKGISNFFKAFKSSKAKKSLKKQANDYWYDNLNNDNIPRTEKNLNDESFNNDKYTLVPIDSLQTLYDINEKFSFIKENDIKYITSLGPLGTKPNYQELIGVTRQDGFVVAILGYMKDNDETNYINIHFLSYQNGVNVSKLLYYIISFLRQNREDDEDNKKTMKGIIINKSFADKKDINDSLKNIGFKLNNDKYELKFSE